MDRLPRDIMNHNSLQYFEIDLENRLSSNDIHHLLPEIKDDALYITRLSDANGIDMIYDRGTVLFHDTYHGTETLNIDASPWLNLLSAPKITEVFVDNLSSQMISNLPPNIKTLLIDDHLHLFNISNWINSPSSGVKREIVYTGSSPEHTPVFHKINNDIIRLVLPLCQDFDELIKNNPQLQAIGINGDKCFGTGTDPRRWEQIRNLPVDLTVWYRSTEILHHTQSYLGHDGIKYIRW